MRGLAAELGDFAVDVKTWKPKDEAKIAEVLKGYDLSSLGGPAESTSGRQPTSLLSPPITTTDAPRPTRGVIKPGRYSQQQPTSLADSIAAKVQAALKK
jgi:hypothetical protein